MLVAFMHAVTAAVYHAIKQITFVNVFMANTVTYNWEL